MTDITIRVDVSGPLSDGTARDILDRYAENLKQKLAGDARNKLETLFHLDFRHPDGEYENELLTDRAVNDLVVHDRIILYGPWLEGTGSMNFPKTRFKGYHMYRIATQELNTEAGAIADAELHDGGYLDEMDR